MIDPRQFRVEVIRPTLALIGLGGLAAENLLLGTALTESGLMWLRQIGGPALGVYQCELSTLTDLLTNFLAYRPQLAALIYPLHMSSLSAEFNLCANLAYATAICRAHYYRVPDPLPAEDDAAGMAQYHKRFYNSVLGATDPAESVVSFRRAIATT